MTSQRARKWLLIAGMIIVVVVVIMLLSGCVIEQEARGDRGKFAVDVDCKEDAKVEVRLNLNRDESKDRAKTDGIPVPIK